MTASKTSSKSSSSTRKRSRSKSPVGPTEIIHVDNVVVVNYDLGADKDHRPALVGHFGDVISGEHSGRYGVVEAGLDPDELGLPQKVQFRTRDGATEDLVVNYKDVAFAKAGHR